MKQLYLGWGITVMKVEAVRQYLNVMAEDVLNHPHFPNVEECAAFDYIQKARMNFLHFLSREVGDEIAKLKKDSTKTIQQLLREYEERWQRIHLDLPRSIRALMDLDFFKRECARHLPGIYIESAFTSLPEDIVLRNDSNKPRKWHDRPQMQKPMPWNASRIMQQRSR